MKTVAIGNDFSLENLSQIDVEIDPRHGPHCLGLSKINSEALF